MVSDARHNAVGSKGSRAIGVILLALGISSQQASCPIRRRTIRIPAIRQTTALTGPVARSLLRIRSFFGIGYAAYLLPLLALVWGWNRLWQHAISHALYRSGTLLSICLLFCVGAGLPLYSSYTAFELGGWLGTYSSEVVLIPYAGRIGSAILLVALSIAALVLTTDINLRPVVRVVVAGAAGLRNSCVF